MKAAIIICITLLMACRANAQYARLRAVSDSFHIQSNNTFLAKPVWNRLNMALPSDYYCHDLGFFCKEELKLQKANIPVIFRLGSVEDCNRMEQKPGYR